MKILLNKIKIHTGAVRCVVIVTKDSQRRLIAKSYLSDVRHDIRVRLSGILANTSGWMSSNRIEIPKGDDVPKLYKEKEVKFILG